MYILELGGLAIYASVSVSGAFLDTAVFNSGFLVFNLLFLLSKETIHFLV